MVKDTTVPHKKHHIIAIITTKRGRVLSRGENSYVKTSTDMYRFGKKFGIENQIYLHAECHALSQLRGEDLNRAHSIFVARYSRFDGRPMLAKPCKICENMLLTTLPNLKKITWTVPDTTTQTRILK